MRRALLLAAQALMVVASISFDEWRQGHGKAYSTLEEHKYRSEVFAQNVAWITKKKAYNATSFTLDVNRFADLTHEEFKQRYVGGKRMSPRNELLSTFESPALDLPTSWDWEAKGKVTRPLNQGNCGSCWAFSVVEAVESIVAIKTGTLYDLSEQQVVDCDKASGNEGCNGGNQVPAFDWIKKNGGLCLAADYPYTAKDGKCKSCKVVPNTNITGVQTIGKSDAALLAALYQQPVSLSVDADAAEWQFYSGGVLDIKNCGTSLDHAVLGVGYGVDSKTGLAYYKVLNSWGADWGVDGNILIARGSKYEPKGECGILMDNSIPLKDN